MALLSTTGTFYYLDFFVMNRGGLYHILESKLYGRVTNDTGLLRRAMNDINGAFPNTYCSSSPPTQLIIVTWIDYQKTNTRKVSIIIMFVCSIQHNNLRMNSYVHYRTIGLMPELSSIPI